MDAVTRNRCEAELLAIFQEVALALGVICDIEAQALAEGGLREVWKWIGANAAQLNVVLPIVAILVALAPQLHESEEEALSKELSELNIEEKKLQIEKLRRELREADSQEEGKFRDKALKVLKRDPKILVRRSNFYKNLLYSERVESLGFTALDAELLPAAPENIVPNSEFLRFVLNSHSIKSLIIDDAKIEIISPVLREGRYKWKGIYGGKIIGFTMQDSAFQSLVLREAVTFQHGTFLNCVLNIHRKLDEVGEVEVTGYVVTTVISKYDERQTIETSQGRAYKHIKALSELQHDLFSDTV